MTRRRCILAKSLLLAWLAAATGAWAQDQSISGIPTDGSATTEQLDAVISAYESREGLDEGVRNSILDQLRDARAQVEAMNAAEAATEEFAAALDSAPAETGRLRTSLEEVAETGVTAESLGITDLTTLSELEQQLTREQANLADAESALSRLEAQIASEETRPAAAASQRLAAQSAELRRLEQELLSNTARVELLNAQREMMARNRLETERRLDVIRTEVNRQRQETALLAQQAAAAAELAAADKHPAVRALAEGNANLTSELPSLVASIEGVTRQLDSVNAEERELEERLARSRQRVEIGGLSREIGQLLEEERRNLPQISRYRGAVRSRSSLLAGIGLAQLRIQEERRTLTPLDAAVERAMADIGDDVTDEQEIAGIREEVRLLLRDRRDLLAQAERTYSTYLQVHADLDAAQRQLLTIARDYQDFLREHQLWIPSATVLGLGEWRDVLPALQWAFSGPAWRDSLATLADSLNQNLSAAVFALILLIAVVLLQRPLLRKYQEMSARVGRLSTDSIWLTIGSLGIAAVRALPVPSLFMFASWFLNLSHTSSPFTVALASSLGALAPFLYNLMLFRVLSAKGGILELHFGWQNNGLAKIRKQLDRLITLGSPLIFVTVFFYLSDLAGDRATLGRAAFILLMALLSSVIHPLSHPETGVVSTYYDRRPDYWVTRLRWFWYGLGTGGPVVLALLSILGYLYTSLVLTVLLIDTIWLVLAMILINIVVLRWLVLARRKLALKLLLEEREARRAEREAEGHAEEEDGDVPAAAQKPLDLDDVDLQTRKILRSGLLFVAVVAGWGIWADVLPAFNLLNQVSLWTKATIVEGVEAIEPVTLADIALAAVVTAVTAVAYRNLPGLMEITVLQRLTLQPGSRYTINTLVRYTVITIGVFSVLSIVGWNWSQIQWLVAALSVGLGFGLQEIVANFVSGLIILFERPVRVGDTVTVGQLTGNVSRVRIRATTITDWDRKEIIVPNKSFITEQVVNWTLSDPITRITIPVGISYGSDVELAHRVMADTLHSLPLVLEEPAPRVFFIGFGDSSLNFRLDVHSRQLSDRLPLTHAVHESILAALRENGIEIPFPQRDLHIRSTVESKAPADD